MYIDIDTHECDADWTALLRKKHPNTSFPYRLDDNSLMKMGIHPVVQPELKLLPDGLCYEREKPSIVDGVWTQNWRVVKCP